MLAPAQLDRLIVILVGARNPNNIGAAARAMSNFGFPHLRIVNTYQVAFQEARSAVGAADLLASAQQFSSLQQAIADCTLVVGTTAVGDRELLHPLHRLEAAAALIQNHIAHSVPPSAPAPRVALLFGSEKTGLSNEDLSHCHWLLRIPTRAEHISMNLGQAVALCVYELVRQDPQAQAESQAESQAGSQAESQAESRTESQTESQPGSPGEEHPATEAASASSASLDRLLSLLVEALQASGYFKSDPDATALQKLRRLILRLNPSSEDTEILLGMLRQLLWKLKHHAAPVE